MKNLVSLGQLVGLDRVSAEFTDQIGGHQLPDPAPFLQWCERILVDYPEGRALLLAPGTVVNGDLLAERDASELSDHSITTIACFGDLTIEGRLVNEDPDDGPFVLVAGSLMASEVVKGGAGIAVLGSVICDGVIFCDDETGALHVGGDIRCKALIDSDHDIYAAGQIEGLAISDDLGNMRTMLVSDCFEDPGDPEDQWPLGELIRERLLSGQPVLK